MKPIFQDKFRTLWNGNALVMRQLAAESVQCVVTSPPYWGLRKYKGRQVVVWDSGNGCAHEWGPPLQATNSGGGWAKPGYERKGKYRVPGDGKRDWGLGKVDLGMFCQKCGDWKGAFGNEPTPELYVEHTVQVLRSIRRVLRKDGVVFWNVGDNYYGSANGYRAKGQHGITRVTDEEVAYPMRRKQRHLKPKDLTLIPFRVAIAAQEDGWYVRADIIWQKKNCKPESVRDRPTKVHEHIFMLTKSPRYFWNEEESRESASDWGTRDRAKYRGGTADPALKNRGMADINFADRGRNMRSVWSMPTVPPKVTSKIDHFAVFPEELPERAIRAATRENDLVLDPFAGQGTTLLVAARLGRRSVGFEISRAYCQLAIQNNNQLRIV